MDELNILASEGDTGKHDQKGSRGNLHVATAPELESVSGRLFDGRREARAHDAAYDARQRQRLRTFALELTGQSIDVTR